MSLKHLCSVYNDITMVDKLNYAMQDRYPSDISDHTCLHSNLIQMLRTEENFKKLYFTLQGDKMCTDPKRPKLD